MSCLRFHKEWVLWAEYGDTIEGYSYLVKEEDSFKQDHPDIPIRKKIKSNKLILEIYI